MMMHETLTALLVAALLVLMPAFASADDLLLQTAGISLPELALDDSPVLATEAEEAIYLQTGVTPERSIWWAEDGSTGYVDALQITPEQLRIVNRNFAAEDW